MAKVLPPGQIVLRDLRQEFFNYGAATEYEEGDGKWRRSGTFLIANDDPQLEAFKALLLTAAMTAWPPTPKDPKIPQKMLAAMMAGGPQKSCLYDGMMKPQYASFQDRHAIAAHRYIKDGRPKIFDSDKTEIYNAMDECMKGREGRFYRGCRVDVHLAVYAHANHGGGLRATLMSVIRRGDAPSFGGAPAPDPDALEAIEEGIDDIDDISGAEETALG